MKNIQDILSQLTTAEKVQLTTGNGYWNTAAVERLGIGSVSVADGPIGLRKEVDGQTLPSVCFPSISKLACSFDPTLLREVGGAIGEQCRAQNVNVLLAPGLNIKRNLRCGRNFEYFSEDPYLTAELANGYIKGVNSQGVGVCVKHFAGNSQEYGRRVCDSIIDERTLREIYLKAFERVIKTSKPVAVMCAYNKLNGEYCCQNRRLLTEILREEWKFDGLVMSDWGATDDRPKGIAAGLDLQMPQGNTEVVQKAIQTGQLLHADLTPAVERIVKFALNFNEPSPRTVNLDYQHTLAGRVSAETTVLAKNQCNLLPFALTDQIAVVGLRAEQPYFQGGGSSKVVPYKLETLLNRLDELGANYTYAAGYTDEGTTEQLLDEARSVAEKCSKVLLIVGCPSSESEGYDRTDWVLPQAQLQVIDAVTAVNNNVAVVVQSGAPVDVSWHHSCRAVLLDYLAGENCGALADVVFGKLCPTGRLAETWPLNLPKLDADYSSQYKRALYRESIFVGYRYYTTANVEVAFPFGHGLNYNQFVWGAAQVAPAKGGYAVSLEVKNIGTTEDADTVQVYLTNVDSRRFSAKKNLVGFKKVRLKGGEAKNVTVNISLDDFAQFDVSAGKFVVNGGDYILTVAKNCNDAGQQFVVHVDGPNNTVDESQTLDCYYNVDEDFFPTDSQYEALFGTFAEQTVTPFTVNSPLDEISTKLLGKVLIKAWTANQPDARSLLATPLIDFAYLRKDVSGEMVQTLVDMLNGAFWKNLFKLFQQWMKHKSAGKHK